MQLSDFDYQLPKELIAQKPIRPRDQSRLMVLNRRAKQISHHFFYEIEKFLRPDDVLVLNDSKVIPARLIGQKETGGRVEILLLRKIKSNIWEALIKLKIKNISPRLTRLGREKPKIQIKNKKFKNTNLLVEPIRKISDGRWLIKFNLSGEKLKRAIYQLGSAPTPPYIKRLSNLKEYQTIYAKDEGSVAAPTAGFHFTKRLINQLKRQGIRFEFVTLHVGLGTFQPVKIEKIEEHKIHSEFAILSSSAAKRINQAKKNSQRIIAVGTTSVRVLESFFNREKRVLETGTKWINLFIYPGYKFQAVDGLITNFHLPKSTLLMLVSAFAGQDFILRAYQEAMKNKYRFYSFGDAMLII